MRYHCASGPNISSEKESIRRYNESEAKRLSDRWGMVRDSGVRVAIFILRNKGRQHQMSVGLLSVALRNANSFDENV